MDNVFLRQFTFELTNWATYLVPFLIVGLFLAGLVLLIYNLIKTGKNGFGWATILFLVGVLAFMLRVAISVFREMAAGSSSDWDS